MPQSKIVRVSNWIEVRTTDPEEYPGTWTQVFTDMEDALEEVGRLEQGVYE